MELAVVIRELDKIRAVRQLTLDDWTQVVHENVYEAGAYCYFSQDFSDLNALLDQVIQAQGARWRY
jgi:L-lactate utilization protein LutB